MFVWGMYKPKDRVGGLSLNQSNLRVQGIFSCVPLLLFHLLVLRLNNSVSKRAALNPPVCWEVHWC